MDGHRDPEQSAATLTVADEGQLHDVRVASGADQRYRLRDPLLSLRVETGDVTVVSDSFSTVYGTGDDLDAAIADYLRTLFDYFEKLEQREDRLARGLRQELAVLRRHIVHSR